MASPEFVRLSGRRWRRGSIIGAALVGLILVGLLRVRASTSAQPEVSLPSHAPAINRATVSWMDAAGAQRTAIVFNPVAGGANLPALIFSPGFGQRPANYFRLLDRLASGGFVVIAVAHPENVNRADASLFDASGIIARGISSAVDHFLIEQRRSAYPFSRVDTARIGAIGHSVGGAAAALALATDGRIKAGMNLDGTLYGPVVKTGVTKPFFILMASLPWTERFRRNPPKFYEDRDQARLHEDMFFARSPRAYWLTVDHLDHMAFTDATLGVPARLAELMGMRLDAPRTREIASRYALTFFGKYLGTSNTDDVILRKAYFPGTQLISRPRDAR